MIKIKKQLFLLLFSFTLSASAEPPSAMQRAYAVFAHLKEKFYSLPLFAGYHSSAQQKEEARQAIKDLLLTKEQLLDNYAYAKNFKEKQEIKHKIDEIDQKIYEHKITLGTEWTKMRTAMVYGARTLGAAGLGALGYAYRPQKLRQQINETAEEKLAREKQERKKQDKEKAKKIEAEFEAELPKKSKEEIELIKQIEKLNDEIESTKNDIEKGKIQNPDAPILNKAMEDTLKILTKKKQNLTTQLGLLQQIESKTKEIKTASQQTPSPEMTNEIQKLVLERIDLNAKKQNLEQQLKQLQPKP